jgi:hypothetical protein
MSLPLPLTVRVVDIVGFGRGRDATGKRRAPFFSTCSLAFSFSFPLPLAALLLRVHRLLTLPNTLYVLSQAGSSSPSFPISPPLPSRPLLLRSTLPACACFAALRT